MKLRWGIVGLGQLANEWIAPAIKASKKNQLVACADALTERADQFGKNHGIDHVYYAFQEMVKDSNIDAVYVATPNSLHHPVVIAAARAGKHVLCQKPMAINLKEAEEMIEACRNNRVELRIGLQLRFQKVLQLAADLVRSGRVGQVREVTAQRYAPMHEAKVSAWRYDLGVAGAGALSDVGVHTIDFVQWVVADRIRRVFAVSNPPRASGATDDTITVLFEFEHGCQATIRCSREMPVASNDLQIFGTGGKIITGPLRGVDQYKLLLRAPSESKDFEFQAENLYFVEIESFAAITNGKSSPAVTGEEGMKLVEVTDAVIHSLRTGNAVTI